jgi:hypothetical protein
MNVSLHLASHVLIDSAFEYPKCAAMRKRSCFNEGADWRLNQTRGAVQTSKRIVFGKIEEDFRESILI